MLYNIKGRMIDGRTISGHVSGGNPVEATAGFVTKNQLKAEELSEVKLKLVDETTLTAKVRPPRKPRESTTEGATAADKQAGANQMASVERESKAPQATRPSPRR